jgi:cytochrome b6-f complex iron-sulfur subunit
MNDPKDLAEALRRAGAERQKAAKAPAEPAKAKHAAKPKAVPPRPSREAATAAAQAQAGRRGFLIGMSISSILLIGWGAFLTGVGAFTAMTLRFMFPNVLAEPPSTIKVGLPTNFEKDEVNERWKAEWGFWIVRSSAYNGQDSIYALQSICTHLGCPPNWLAGEQKFKCPCHGSGFYISGVNFEGPAPRPLERFKISVGDDNNLIGDKSQKFQEELGPVVRPPIASSRSESVRPVRTPLARGRSRGLVRGPGGRAAAIVRDGSRSLAGARSASAPQAPRSATRDSHGHRR